MDRFFAENDAVAKLRWRLDLRLIGHHRNRYGPTELLLLPTPSQWIGGCGKSMASEISHLFLPYEGEKAERSEEPLRRGTSVSFH
jgi:hypothetical protein